MDTRGNPVWVSGESAGNEKLGQSREETSRGASVRKVSPTMAIGLGLGLVLVSKDKVFLVDLLVNDGLLSKLLVLGRSPSLVL